MLGWITLEAAARVRNGWAGGLRASLAWRAQQPTRPAAKALTPACCSLTPRPASPRTAQVVTCACDLGTFTCGLLVAILPPSNSTQL